MIVQEKSSIFSAKFKKIIFLDFFESFIAQVTNLKKF